MTVFATVLSFWSAACARHAPDSAAPSLTPPTARPSQGQETAGTSGISLTVPDSIGAFRMIQRKEFENAGEGVMLRYRRMADSLQADVFVYAGPGFDAECDSACARDVLRREGDDFVAAFPELRRLRYVDTIAVASDRILTPPVGALWRMGRHLRFHQRRQGRSEWSDLYLYYLPGYRIKVRATYPPDSTRAVAAAELATAAPHAIANRSAVPSQEGAPTSALDRVVITTTLAGTPLELYPMVLKLLSDHGYAIEDSSAGRGRIVTAPRYAWPKGSEDESWHGTDSPGVRLFITFEGMGDSTKVGIAGQSPTRPNWTEPKVAETLELISIMEMAAALPEATKREAPIKRER